MIIGIIGTVLLVLLLIGIVLLIVLAVAGSSGSSGYDVQQRLSRHDDDSEAAADQHRLVDQLDPERVADAVAHLAGEGEQLGGASLRRGWSAPGCAREESRTRSWP